MSQVPTDELEIADTAKQARGAAETAHESGHEPDDIAECKDFVGKVIIYFVDGSEVEIDQR